MCQYLVHFRREIGTVRRKKTFNLASEEGTSSYYKPSNVLDDGSEKGESDKDDSSVDDEEGEPGCPSRPSSPPLTTDTTSRLTLGINTFLSKRRPSIEQNKSPASKEKGPTLFHKEIAKNELKQPSIDSFFSKIENPFIKKKEDLPPDPPVAAVTVESEPEPEPEPVIVPVETRRKRGRPSRNNLSAIGMIGKSKEHSLRSDVKDASSEEKSVAHEKDKHSNRSDPTASVVTEKSLFSKQNGLFKKSDDGSSLLPTDKEGTQPPQLGLPQASSKESFQVYRQGGEITQETDDDTQSESNSSSDDSDEDSMSESVSDEAGSDTDTSSTDGFCSSGDQIPLEPLDLVWAKCRGYPWYPALIINPKMPRTGYYHNRVPIPVPPEEVLALAANYANPMYLVLFFDLKRTWQWLPRNKLEPLGVNSALDKVKLVHHRKPTDRKAVRRAYEKAILHRCRVTGDNAGISGESDNEISPD